MRILLALAAAALLSVPAFAGATPPPPTAEQQAAITACKAQGFASGSDAYHQCIAKLLGGTAPKPSSQMQAAVAACAAQGLTQGTDAFAQCVQTQLGSGKSSGPQTPATTACGAKGLQAGSDAFNACVKDYDAQAAKKPNGPKPAQQGTSGPVSASDQAAIDGCKASGIQQGTDAFKACVVAASAAASVSGWSGEQLAAYNACKAAGNAFPSAAFASCLSKVLTKIVPSKSAQKSVKDVEAAAAVCSTKKYVGTPFLQCIKDQVSAP